MDPSSFHKKQDTKKIYWHTGYSFHFICYLVDLKDNAEMGPTMSVNGVKEVFDDLHGFFSVKCFLCVFERVS